MKSRQTKQKEILDATITNMDSFFTASELHQKALEKDAGIGIATVYRFLQDAVTNKTLHSYICDRKGVYSKTKQHCHFIDEETQEVHHFHIENIDFLKKYVPGKISSFSIEVKGRKK